MARFLMGTIPVVGHVSPGVAIARALINRGHEVCWYTGRAFQKTVETTGAQFVPIASGLDYSDPKNVPQEWMDQRNTLRGSAQLKFDLKHFFIDAAVGQVKDIQTVLQEFSADVMVTDSFFLGAGWVHELGGPPWAEFGISALGFSSRDTAPFGLGLKPNASFLGRLRNRFLNRLSEQLLFRELTNHANGLRNDLGLPPSTQSFFNAISPFLYLAGTVPSFEYPRSDLPPQVHFIGPLVNPSPTEFVPPVWWSDLQGKRPVVFVTQGTVATKLEELVIPTLQALQNEDVLVIGTTAEVKPDALGCAVPENARLEQYIPFSNLLPYVDVMVTNGGFNGVQLALSNGVPLVTAGQTEDKPEVCARVEWCGAGIDLKTKSPGSDRIKQAVRQVLSGSFGVAQSANRRYKDRALAIQSEIQQYHAADLAADFLEQLAATQQPILRC